MMGSALFTATTLMAGFAPDETILVMARALQGISAAILSPAALSIILVRFSAAKRAKAMAAWGAASAAGGAIGVAAGGLITAALSWQWVFYLTVPITLLTFVMAPLLFAAPSAITARRSFDVWGAVSITGSALFLTYATLSVANRGWLDRNHRWRLSRSWIARGIRSHRAASR